VERAQTLEIGPRARQPHVPGNQVNNIHSIADSPRQDFPVSGGQFAPSDALDPRPAQLPAPDESNPGIDKWLCLGKICFARLPRSWVRRKNILHNSGWVK